jgi:hypothetical protein
MMANSILGGDLRREFCKRIVRRNINGMKERELMPRVEFNSSAKHFLVSAGAFLSLVSFAVAGQNNSAKTGAWSGVLVTSACNADEAFNESPECFKIVPGAKIALYDDTNRVMYSLEPQEKVTGHLGDTVTVRGTLEEDTIQVASAEPMAIGLAVGQKAPNFSARDEFGRVQTLESLKGPNGTVLLFFRSADW